MMPHTIVDKIFTHLESGKEVKTLEWIRVKMTDTWVEVIVYEHEGKKFARPYDQFELRFKEKV